MSHINTIRLIQRKAKLPTVDIVIGFREKLIHINELAENKS